MNRSLYPLSFVCLLASLTLAGCSGMAAFPDSSDPGSDSHPGAIQGSVFGGHAPVVDAHVYVFQAGTSGYASAAVSKITAAGGAGPDSSGRYYVVTAADGSFGVTGDYSCTPGLPVYLAAIGGTPYVATGVASPPAPTPVIITSATTTGTNGTGKFILQFTANNLFYQGEQVTFSGLVGTGWTSLNTTTQTVNTATPTLFTILYAAAGPATASQPATAKATAVVPTVPPGNPAIANLAVLGNCPTEGNFSTSGTGSDVISFVYINEVSTAAAAYALSGFGSGPYNIGTANDTMAKAGIENAANNAAQLYSIQGKYNNPTDGEGHIANLTTPVGGGTVSQKALDTVGNILASCVDSANTANNSTNPTTTGASSSCVTLFTNATSNGIPYGNSGHGTVATDTATAAFNIAHHPAGNPTLASNPFVTNLFALQAAETAPFTPDDSTTPMPTDYSVAISYPVKGQPQSVAVDGSGNYWYTSQITAAPTYPCTNTNCGTSILAENSPNGQSLYTYTNNASSSWDYGDVTIDSSGNAWTGNQSGYVDSSEVIAGTTGSTTAPYLVNQTFTYAAGPVADSSGDVYFVHGPTAGFPQTGDNIELTEINSGRGSVGSQPSIATSFSTGSGSSEAYYNVRHGALDQAGYLWLVSEGGSIISRIQDSSTSGNPATGFPIGNPTYPTTPPPCTTSISTPEQPAIDSFGYAWIPINNSGTGNTVLQVSPAGVCNTVDTGFGPYGAAVDGSGNVWISNYASNTITEINASTATPAVEINAGTATTSTFEADGLLSEPEGMAVDISGDLLITDYTGTSYTVTTGTGTTTITTTYYNGDITEVIGIATPTYNPLGLAAGTSKLGVQP
jgi:hypothetical protein